MNMIKEFFNNASVSAFCGALFAYLLVWFTDRRRDKKKIGHIRCEIEHNLFHAKKKLESVRRSFVDVTEHNKIAAGRVLHFNTEIVQRLLSEALDAVSTEQRRAVDALCFTMLECDRLLDELYACAAQFGYSLGQAERMELSRELLDAHKEAIIALGRLVQMSEWYSSGKFTKILNHHYNRVDYIEWNE